MFDFEIKKWKVPRFIKDPEDYEACVKLLRTHLRQVTSIFINLIATSTYPNISWIDFSNFVSECKLVDGKNLQLSTIDRLFIATNFEVEQNSLNPDNALVRFEFYEILLRLVGARFKDPGITNTYAEGFEKLRHYLVQRHPWQEFRDERLWTLEVNDVMEANIEGLKKVSRPYEPPKPTLYRSTRVLKRLRSRA